MRRLGVACVLSLVWSLGSAAPARVLVVSGISGEAVYAEQFEQWAVAMLDAARDRLALEPADVVWLCEQPQRGGGRCAAAARRDAVLGTVSRLATAPPHDAPLLILLIGHGTARDGRALFNLPGPDLAPEDLAGALAGAGERPVAVVNTTASSAPFVAALSRPGRVVVSATAHAAEDDFTRFAGHFVAAWSGGEADADKDRRVSLLEAFRFAVARVGREYAASRQLLTEHALLDDDGDGRGARDVDPVSGDGVVAARFYLAARAAAAADSPDAAALEEQARAVIAELAALRRSRAAMPVERYEVVLESLLVALALNRRALRRLEQ